ncbi:uncharacterized protein LOC126668276 [Mercurialis annua]|uniref:uncharacterized protein LOC126668276 n=1 Tax=Mercurialis annua TaxID=3986 RepID=UPI00216034B9|nr:uncharacterized protein LOC126668276 [Mercurialis annua]
MATENFTHTLCPYFDGTNYPNLKFCMKNYLDMDEKEWTKDHIQANALNRKVICVIFYSLCREEQERVQHYSTAQDMWKILENYHEGRVQIKIKKVELLIGEYEAFKNKPNENVTDTTNRLLAITTNFKNLGKHYTIGEINGKILRPLPLLDWQPNITAIEEAHDLNKLRTDELIGNFLLREMTYMKSIQELKRAQEEKTKGIALKAKAIETKVEEEINLSDGEDGGEMVLMSKKVRDWKLRKKSQVQRYVHKGDSSNSKRSSPPRKEVSTPRRDVTCYGCGKSGHTKPECRQGANRSFQKDKKGFVTTWDDESNCQSDGECQEEERANLRFMAFEEEHTSKVSSLPFLSWDGIGIETHDSFSDIVVMNNVDSVDNDECHYMINELTTKCSDYHAKMKVSKRKTFMAKIEMLNLKKEIHDLKSYLKYISKQDVNVLSKENEKLNEKESLDNLLDSKRNPTIKFGLDYSHNPSISNVTTFVKASSHQTSSIEVSPILA